MRFFTALLACFFLVACIPSESDPLTSAASVLNEQEVTEELPLMPLKNYLMKNKMSAKTPIHLFAFADKKEFSKELGTSTRMPAPTKIDFKKEVPVLMVLPDSKTERKILVEDITKQGNNIHVVYKIEEVKARAFSAPTVYMFKVDRFAGLLDFYFFDVTDETNEKENRIPFGNRVIGSPVSTTDLLANYTGTFKGVVPCASCAGIETTLTFSKDMTYTLTRVYLDRDDDVYKEEGTFEITDDLSAIKLDYKSEVSYYFLLNKDAIEQMDTNGKRIQSTHNYILTRK